MQNTLCLLPAWILVFACTLKFSKACECGRVSTDRIYYGSEVPNSDFPWMARLYFTVDGTRVGRCGASMISTRYAVTAGHCVPESSSAKSYLVFGNRSVNRDLFSEKSNVEKFIVKGRDPIHEDLALIKLRRSVNVVPICLPHADESFADVRATMLGYGLTESDHNSKNLLAGEVTVPSNAKCEEVQRKLLSNHICSGNYDGGPAFCLGDSGGPLMYLDKTVNRWVLIGVISGTPGCTRIDKYGLCTRVTSFLPWIQKKSNNAGCQDRAN